MRSIGPGHPMDAAGAGRANTPMCGGFAGLHRQDCAGRNPTGPEEVVPRATSAVTEVHFCHRAPKRRRAPPGGRAAPARTVRPWGGRPAPSLWISLSAKCPRMRQPPVSFSRLPVAYPPRVPVAASANQITTYAEGSEKGLSRDWLPRSSSFHLVRLRRASGDRGSDTVRKHRMYTIPPLLSSPKGSAGRRNGRAASYKLTACDRSD